MSKSWLSRRLTPLIKHLASVTVSLLPLTGPTMAKPTAALKMKDTFSTHLPRRSTAPVLIRSCWQASEHDLHAEKRERCRYGHLRDGNDRVVDRSTKEAATA